MTEAVSLRPIYVEFFFLQKPPYISLGMGLSVN